MDAMKRTSMRFVEGPGGLGCPCCGALGTGDKRKAKPALRRATRRAMRQEVRKLDQEEGVDGG